MNDAKGAQNKQDAIASPHDGYVSPLAGRYASEQMQRIWSSRHKFALWRKIWLALAEAQHEVGLPVTKEQVEELRANLEVTDEDIENARQYEKKLRHDVMSHVHAWGERCPKARGIIHLGMTSQDVNDNCELVQIGAALSETLASVESLLLTGATCVERTASMACVGYTHYQPAQPVTLGRRIAGYLYDLRRLMRPLHGWIGYEYPVRGLRGATGTQASYLSLCEGNKDTLAKLESEFVFRFRQSVGMEDAPSLGAQLQDDIAISRAASAEVEREISEMLRESGATNELIQSVKHAEEEDSHRSAHDHVRDYVSDRTFMLVGQTYPRSVDAQVGAALANIAVVLHKMATDIRLLCNLGEVSEPFETNQIGSSAMPYKRNPMRCERVCGLARFVWNLVPNAYDTAATQWLERTLDDSSNRRLVLPEAFLALDAALNIMHNVISGLVVHEKVIARNLQRELPFLATESLMMSAVKLGRDRQDVHEAIRQHAMAAKHRMVEGDGENDLVERLKAEPLLEGVDIDAELVPERHIGLAVQQTERFIAEVIEPMRERLDDERSENQPEELDV